MPQNSCKAVVLDRGVENSARSGKSEIVTFILHYNIQCLRNKLHQLEAFLLDKEYDILCINEHWLNKNEISCMTVCNYVNISGFSRVVRCHGGVAVYAKVSTVSFC